MVDFHHNRGVHMLNVGCTLPSLAINFLHKSFAAKFYPFRESEKKLLEKNSEHMVGGLSFVITRKSVVDNTSIRDSTILCGIIVRMDASQLYPLSMCQAMPTGLYTRWELDSEPGKFIPCQNKSRSFENMVKSYFPRLRPQCNVESFYTTGTQNKVDA